MEQSLDPLPQRIAALAAGKYKKPSQPQQQCDLGNHIAPFLPPSLSCTHLSVLPTSLQSLGSSGLERIKHLIFFQNESCANHHICFL